LLAVAGAVVAVTSYSTSHVTRKRQRQHAVAIQPTPRQEPIKYRDVLGRDASASFARLSGSLPGRVELAVVPLGSGPIEVLGGDERAHGWSTTKVPVLVALIRAREQIGRAGLSSQQRLLARAAITESSNEAILSLFGALEEIEGGLEAASLTVQHVLHLSGDDETVVTTAPPPVGAVTTFGQTGWSPRASAMFFRAFADGCLLPAADTSYLLGLMQEIVPSESWGLGSAGFPSVAFKGGWGPDPSGDYLVRQSGIVDPGSSAGVAVSIVAFPASGAFSAGTALVSEVADWLHRELRLTPHGRPTCPER